MPQMTGTAVPPVKGTEPARRESVFGKFAKSSILNILLAIYALVRDFDVGAPIVAGLCAIAVYIIGSDAVIRRIKSFKA